MKIIYKILSVLILIIPLFFSNAFAENLPHSSPGWFGGPTSSPFGYRVDPVTGAVGAFHEGIDIAVPLNTKAPAAADGTVTFAGWAGGYGNYVEVTMPNGYVYAYGHLNAIFVNVGDNVKKGDVIALSGSTGKSTGPHMHIELVINGEHKDPYAFYTGAGWTLEGSVPYEEGNPENGKNYQDEVIDFQSYFELSFEAADTFAKILVAITKAINLIQSHIIALLLSLITLDLIIRYTYSIFTNNKESFLQSLTERLFKYSIILAFIVSWATIAELIKNFAFEVADTAYVGSYNNEYLIADPSILFKQVGHLYKNYINNSVMGIITFASPTIQSVLMSIPGISFVFELYYLLILCLLTLTLLFAAYIVCYISWTIVFFYLTIFCCLIGLPFSAFKITEKKPAMMYKSLGLQCLHLAIISIVFNMMYTYFTSLDQNDIGIGALILCMVNMGCLAFVFPSITSKINGAFAGE